MTMDGENIYLSEHNEQESIAERVFKMHDIAAVATAQEVLVEEKFMPKILLVTDLGNGNLGAIGASDLTVTQRDELLAQINSEKFYNNSPEQFACIDHRDDAMGGETPEAQTAGSPTVTGSAASMMTDSEAGKLSELIIENTVDTINAGTNIVMHGDESGGKAGCGANKHMRTALKHNAEHADVVIEKGWALSEALELPKHGLQKSDLMDLILAGHAYASDDSKWDLSPEEVVDLAVQHGANYVELKGSHKEKAIVVIVPHGVTFNRKALNNHNAQAGGFGAFGVTLGELAKLEFAKAEHAGLSAYHAARRTAAGILFNLGVGKVLTAQEYGNGEALPVVVVGA